MTSDRNMAPWAAVHGAMFMPASAGPAVFWRVPALSRRAGQSSYFLNARNAVGTGSNCAPAART